MTSKKQHAANKKNAQKSTGPVTTIGKSKVSVNAVSHGVLSNKLILPGENREEYQRLYDQLVSSLNPVGSLELIVVEKIAVNLWKQQRLIQAESAELSINLRPRIIAETITSILGCTNNPVTVFELVLTDDEHNKWFQAIMDEFKGLNLSYLTDLDDLRDTSYVYELVLQIADASEITIVDFLKANKIDVQGLIESLKDGCIEILYRREEVLQLAELAKIKNTMLGGETEKKLTRYQTSLNNEFYKLINTLRDLKKMQSQFIDGDAITIDQP